MNFVARITKKDFRNDSPLCCTGPQVVEVFSLVEVCCGPVDWYAADLSPSFANIAECSKRFQLAGGTAAVASQLNGILQFECGVFAAVPSKAPPKELRSEAYTDDDVQANLGSSLLELRLFDYSYIEIISTDRKLLKEILSTGFTKEISIRTD